MVRDTHGEFMTAAELEDELMRFTLPLRGGEPLDWAAYERFQNFLAGCSGKLTRNGYMEVGIAMLLIEMHPALLGLAAARHDDERGVIEEWAMDLFCLTQDVLYSPGPPDADR